MNNASIAIETTSREGSLGLAVDGEFKAEIVFNAAMRHAAQLVSRLDDMLKSQGLKPADINEVYVSAGPGSFTGVRLGMTVARTLGYLLKNIKFVSVPTTRAIAQSLAAGDAKDIAVVLDGKGENIYAARFRNDGGLIIPQGAEGIVGWAEFIESLPAGTIVIGEAVEYFKPSRDDIKLICPPEAYPKASNVWAVGRQLALKGEVTELARLLPVYSRKPEAVRLWEKRIDANAVQSA